MPNRLNAYLVATPDLRQLAQHANKLAALQRLYQRFTPASLARASRVMQLDGRTLILAADNGAVASKLRQISDELISSFISGGCEVTGIQIRVQVRVLPQITTSPPRLLGQEGKKALEELAIELEDSPLKDVLNRLAQKD